MIDKQLAHLQPEQLGHAQRERQAGVIFVGFDGIDRLPRDAEPTGQFALTSPRLLAAIPNAILQ